jgi:DNA-binding GntR family transcriptional regulator
VATLFDARALLEGYAAAHAARRMTEAVLGELETLQRELRGLAERIREQGLTRWDRPSATESVRIDLKFHRMILKAANRVAVARIIEQASILGKLINQRDDVPPLRTVAITLLVHGRILRALRSRDPKAARRAMIASIRRGKKTVLGGATVPPPG